MQQELVGELHIGVHTDFRFMRIGGLHRALQHRHPRISPHFTASMSAQILPDIHRGVLDAGFFYGRCNVANLAVTTLMEVPMRVVGPIDWEDKVRDASITELAEMPWVYTSDTCPFFSVSQQLFAPHGITVPKRVAYVDSEDAVRELVRAGAGLSLLRADDADQLEADRSGCCWPGESPSVHAGFAVRRQRAGEPLIRALTEVVSELWFDTQANDARAEA
jgi:DNA-binding transcriptional LysR family regulator